MVADFWIIIIYLQTSAQWRLEKQNETHQSYAVRNFNDQCQWFAFHSAIVLSEMSNVTANVAQQPQELYSIFDRNRKSFCSSFRQFANGSNKEQARLIHKFYKPPDATETRCKTSWGAFIPVRFLAFIIIAFAIIRV